MKRSLTLGSALAVLCFVFAAASLLSSCSTVQKVLHIENPRYSIRNIRPRVDIALPLSASSIDFDFTLGVDNPNSVALRLDRIDFNLFLNENHILDSVSDQGINIPARGIGDVHLTTRVGYQNIRNIFSEVASLIQGNRARYELRGNAYYNTPLGTMKFPVTVYSSR
ncbi:MAG TPA: LEA type 2 family protein [Thermoanaerobaculia bacterium]|nr:LEA type 2 family protein [Thermoanaerobaculia bacterium]